MKRYVGIFLMVLLLALISIVLQSQSGQNCTIIINATNELARNGVVYINDELKGELKSGTLAITGLPVGKHRVIIKSDKFPQYEETVEFTKEFEVKVINFQASSAAKSVQLITVPDGAKVIINGKEVGTTPWKGSLEIGKTYKISLIKEGYQDETFNFEPTTAGGEANITVTLIQKKPEYYVNLKGQLMVTDKLQGLTQVDYSKIPNPLYRDGKVAIWRTQPNARTLLQNWGETYRHLVLNTIPKDLSFYAKLEGDQLSVMIVSSEEASLRGMLGWYDDNDKYTITSPKSGKTDSITGTLACTYNGIHQSRKYDKTRTLIYQVLLDTLEQLIAWGAVNKNVKTVGNPNYFCSFTDKIYVIHYYVTCCEFDYRWGAYHNWPYGDGQDEVHYNSGWFVTEYDDGEAIKKLEFTFTNPKRYFLIGHIANDNGERTKLSLDGSTLLEQVNFGTLSTFRLGSVPPKVIEWYGKKTWSLVLGLIWMAIVADDVKVNVFSQIPGKNPVPEQLDIFEVYKVTKRDIVW